MEKDVYYNIIFQDVKKLIDSNEPVKSNNKNTGILLFYDSSFTVKDFFILPTTKAYSKINSIKNKLKKVYDGLIDDEERYLLEYRIYNLFTKNNIDRKKLKAIMLTECKEEELVQYYNYWNNRLKADFFSLSIPYAIEQIRTLETKAFFMKDDKEERIKISKIFQEIYQNSINFIYNFLQNLNFMDEEFAHKNLELFYFFVTKKLKEYETSTFLIPKVFTKEKNIFWDLFNSLFDSTKIQIQLNFLKNEQ